MICGYNSEAECQPSKLFVGISKFPIRSNFAGAESEHPHQFMPDDTLFHRRAGSNL